MYFQLGWRNLWRNPKRTVVILTAVVIGVWTMIFLSALERGMVNQMVQNGISTLTGHIQVHHKGYRSDPVIENIMANPEEVERNLQKSLPPGSHWTSRVRVNAIVSNAQYSSGVTLVGIGPLQEAQVSFIGKGVTEGRTLLPGDENGILVGKALADKFETRLDRKLVLMSQGTDREIASRAFRIVGIFGAELQATEEQFVFITLTAAQHMLKLPKGISEVSIVLADPKKLDLTVGALRANFSSNDYEVHTWQDLLPFATLYLKIYDQFIYVWFLVVAIAMGFGIANTMLMAVFERIWEFGLLKALGMKPWRIIRVVLSESFFLLLLGMAIGSLFALGSTFVLSGIGIDLSRFAAGSEYFGISRVIYPALSGQDVIMANLIVFIFGLLVSLYPARKVAKFPPVEALSRPVHG